MIYETEEFDAENIVQQGGNWGPVLCRNSFYIIERNCIINDKYLYIYRNAVKIPQLGMIDNLLEFLNVEPLQ